MDCSTSQAPLQQSVPSQSQQLLDIPEPSQPLMSQSDSQPAPQLFLNPDGTPISIFVEANGIVNNRPKLIRTLKRHGANVVPDPGEARIILVEPSSSEGRFFVRDWQQDVGKVILNFAWVHACVNSGRLYLQNDLAPNDEGIPVGYGGFSGLSGAKSDDEDDDDDGNAGTDERARTGGKTRRGTTGKKRGGTGRAAKSETGIDGVNGINVITGTDELDVIEVEKLTTPATVKRKSLPVQNTQEPASPTFINTQPELYQAKAAASSAPPSRAPPSSRSSSRQGTSNAQRMRPPNSESRRSSNGRLSELPTPPSTASSSRINIRNMSPPTLPSQTATNHLYGQHQPPNYAQSSQDYLSQHQPLPQSQLGPYNPQLQMPNSQSHFPTPSMFHPPNNQLAIVSRNQPSTFIPNLPFPSQEQITFFMQNRDAMQTMLQQQQRQDYANGMSSLNGFNAAPWSNGTPSPTDPFGNVMAGFSQSSSFPANFQHHQQMPQQFQTANGYHPDAGFSQSRPQHRLETPPLSSRMSHHTSPTPDSEPATPPIAVLERGRTFELSKGKKRSHEDIYDNGHSPPLPSPEGTRRRKSRKSELSSFPQQRPPPIGIFTAEDGKPMLFYYMLPSVDRENKRGTLLSKIRANGGLITSDIEKATFIILVPYGSNAHTFKNLYDQCRALNRIPLSVGFIEACLEEHTVVEEEEFELEHPKDTKKGGGKPAGSNAPSSKPAASTSTRSASPPASVEVALEHREGFPVPPSVVVLKNGSHKHTEEEKQYVFNVAAMLFREDLNTSLTRLFNVISERCDNHSENAWKSHCSANWSDDIDTLRSRIRAEKQQTATVPNASGEFAEGEMQATATVSNSPSPSHDHDINGGSGAIDVDVDIDDSKQEYSLADVNMDLKNIVTFFLENQIGSDDDLWEGLTREHHCLTARNWQEFYVGDMADEVDRILTEEISNRQS